MSAGLLEPLDEVYLSFFNGNTNIPGSGSQLLHSDGGWVVSTQQDADAIGEAWPCPTADLVFNFSTDDVTEAEGPTQLWPATHTEAALATGAVAQRTAAGFKDPVAAAAEEAARRVVRPPVPNVLPRGAVSVRDYRLWHRGVPNTGTRPRHMIALSYSRRTLHPSRVPKPGKTPSGGGASGRFLFGHNCVGAFSREWWPATAKAALLKNSEKPWPVNFNVDFAPPGVSTPTPPVPSALLLLPMVLSVFWFCSSRLLIS